MLDGGPIVRRLRVSPATCATADLAVAAAWLASGGIVAFPTDTLYGLAVDPRSDLAVAALFDVKGRDQRVAIPLIAASRAVVDGTLGPLDAASAQLADRFWPGPLSLLVDAPLSISRAVHGGAGTLAVRVPSHQVARALAESAGGLVTATSANRHGEPPALCAGALGALAADPRVFVVEGGPAGGGAPSTIVDARRSPAVLVRDGAVPWDRVLEWVSKRSGLAFED
jgi:L-threonylcarbamoyladenylate synthase